MRRVALFLALLVVIISLVLQPTVRLHSLAPLTRQTHPERAGSAEHPSPCQSTSSPNRTGSWRICSQEATSRQLAAAKGAKKGDADAKTAKGAASAKVSGRGRASPQSHTHSSPCGVSAAREQPSNSRDERRIFLGDHSLGGSLRSNVTNTESGTLFSLPRPPRRRRRRRPTRARRRPRTAAAARPRLRLRRLPRRGRQMRRRHLLRRPPR